MKSFIFRELFMAVAFIGVTVIYPPVDFYHGLILPIGAVVLTVLNIIFLLMRKDII